MSGVAVTGEEFLAKYYLGQLITQEPVRSHQALDRTGKKVLVHFFEHASGNRNEPTWARFVKMRDGLHAIVVEVVEVDDTPVVVTKPIAGFTSVPDLLKSLKDASEDTVSSSHPADEPPGELTSIFMGGLDKLEEGPESPPIPVDSASDDAGPPRRKPDQSDPRASPERVGRKEPGGESVETPKDGPPVRRSDEDGVSFTEFFRWDDAKKPGPGGKSSQQDPKPTNADDEEVQSQPSGPKSGKSADEPEVRWADPKKKREKKKAKPNSVDFRWRNDDPDRQQDKPPSPSAVPPNDPLADLFPKEPEPSKPSSGLTGIFDPKGGVLDDANVPDDSVGGLKPGDTYINKIGEETGSPSQHLPDAPINPPPFEPPANVPKRPAAGKARGGDYTEVIGRRGPQYADPGSHGPAPEMDPPKQLEPAPPSKGRIYIWATLGVLFFVSWIVIFVVVLSG